MSLDTSKVRHIGVYVADLKLMKDFYMRCFDFNEKSNATEGGNYLGLLLDCPGISLKNAKLIDENGMILELLETEEMFEDMHSKKVLYRGCFHLAFTVSDVEEKKRVVCGMGGESLSECLISPDGKAKVVFCKDPEGNYLELVEDK